MQAPDFHFSGNLRSRTHFRFWKPCAPTPGTLGGHASARLSIQWGIAEAGHTSDLGSLVPRPQEPWAAMQAPDSQFTGDLRSRAHFRSWQPCAPTPGALGAQASAPSPPHQPHSHSRHTGHLGAGHTSDRRSLGAREKKTTARPTTLLCFC